MKPKKPQTLGVRLFQLTLAGAVTILIANFFAQRADACKQGTFEEAASVLLWIFFLFGGVALLAVAAYEFTESKRKRPEPPELP